MPITLFNVRSNRIHDIKLADGTNVGYLRKILAGAGYDVNDAFITVDRAFEQDKLIGNNDAYVLKEGDGVEFVTSDVSLPAIEQEMARVKAEEQKRHADSGCGCNRQYKFDGVSIDIVKTANGVRIEINH